MLKLLKRFRKQKNSLFVRTFSGLLLLSMTMILFMGCWMNNISGQNYRRQTAMLNLNRLKQTDESMELILDGLRQNMAQIMWSNDFITCMINPNNLEPERDYRMNRQLFSIQSGSELIQNAFLYSPLSGKVYDSETIVSFEDSKYCPILTEHLTKLEQSTSSPDQEKAWKERRRNDTMTVTELIPFEDQLFLIQDLDIASCIGILIYEIDIPALTRTLGLSGTAEETNIFVFDANGSPVFPQTLSYNGDHDWNLAQAGQFLTTENVQKMGGMQTAGFYRYDSPDNGQIYLMPLDTKRLSVRMRDILPMYLIASLMFPALSIVFDYYITHFVYRPINRLMQLVAESAGHEKQSGSTEIDFLENAFSDALDKQSQLKGVLSNIAPDIIDSMLKNLLIGKALEQKRVAEILEGVGNPIHLHDRYLILICQLTEPEERNGTDTELNLHLLSIRNAVEAARNSEYQLFDIRTDKMIVAVIMAFAPEYPVVHIKRECSRLSQSLLKLNETISYRLHTECGNIYQNIMDIRFAYKETLEKLQYQQYLESSAENTQETLPEDNHIVNRRYFKERTKALTELTIHGNKEETEQLLDQILADMNHDGNDVNSFRELAGIFLDELTERVISLPLSREDQELLESTHVITELSGLNTREEISIRILQTARIAVGLLRTYNKKSSCKYVKLAKEYIAQNYADSNLSLNDVSEYIGISPSYLSDLFNEFGGEKFSACLALVRVEKAKQLLRTTNVTIKEIGFCCGFNSIQNFIRVFKKYTNQTPGNYRENPM